jgi:hypothetical protein
MTQLEDKGWDKLGRKAREKNSIKKKKLRLLIAPVLGGYPDESSPTRRSRRQSLVINTEVFWKDITVSEFPIHGVMGDKL